MNSDCDSDFNYNECQFLADSDECASPSSPGNPDDSDGSYKVGPPDIPPGMEVLGYRFSLPHEAINWDDKKRFEIMELFNKKFKVNKYIWAYESKLEGSNEFNPHLHMYVICPIIAKSTRSDWYKKIKHLVRLDAKNRVMIRPETELKNLERYQAYILKDGNYKTNFNDDEIAYIENIKDKIKNDMSKKSYNKLLDRIKEIKEDINNKDFFDLNHICHLIIKIYIEEWDKPPPYYKLKEYSLYIGWKLNAVKAKDPKLIFWE